MIGTGNMNQRFDIRKMTLVLAVIAAFFISYAVIACDRSEIDCPMADDCPVSAAYQELLSGDSSVHTPEVNPPPVLITILAPTPVRGPQISNHVAQRCSRAPPAAA